MGHVAPVARSIGLRGWKAAEASPERAYTRLRRCCCPHPRTCDGRGWPKAMKRPVAPLVITRWVAALDGPGRPLGAPVAPCCWPAVAHAALGAGDRRQGLPAGRRPLPCRASSTRGARRPFGLERIGASSCDPQSLVQDSIKSPRKCGTKDAQIGTGSQGTRPHTPTTPGASWGLLMAPGPLRAGICGRLRHDLRRRRSWRSEGLTTPALWSGLRRCPAGPTAPAARSVGLRELPQLPHHERFRATGFRPRF